VSVNVPVVGQHALQDKTPLLNERWEGTDEEELSCLVSEVRPRRIRKQTSADKTKLCYIHSKVMIVDDRRAICGSANLNDRSQKGDHDSEIAILIGQSADSGICRGN